MKRTMTTWLLGGLLALTGTAYAQNVTPTGEGARVSTPTGEGHSGHMTVREEEIKTWTMEREGKKWDVHPATPGYDGSTGLFHMPTAYTLPEGKFAFSLFRDNYDRDPKDIDFSVHGANMAYGISDALELHAHVGLEHRVDADALFQSGYYNDLPFVRTGWQTGFGDIKIGLKYKFMDDYYGGDPLALALRGYVKLGTADETKGLGTGKPSFGLDLVASKNLGHFADIHGTIGYQINKDPDELSLATGATTGRELDIANAFKYGIGINVPACFWLQLQADLVGLKYQDSDTRGQTNPLDLTVGPVLWIKPGFFIRPALSWNLKFDDRGLGSSSASWTGRHLTIGYHPGTPCREVYVAPAAPPPPVNRNPTATCEIEKSMIDKAGESVRVRAVASDPDGDPLTYAWTTSGGTITGTGSQVTLDTAGVSAPATITVTLRVNDGRGGSGESRCSVSLAAPLKVAEVTTCTSAGFPRNLARLNNVDKACLDDVASRMKQDPRGRLVIIGHADDSERTPDVIATKRAEAVKTYLTAERGVDASRIFVRSAAATRPVDTGKTESARKRNRRVEVIFVPDGAKMPE